MSYRSEDDQQEEDQSFMGVAEMQSHVPPKALGASSTNGKGNGHSDAAEDGEWTSNADVERYIRNCAKFQVPVDPSVIISLQTEWHVMQPTKSFCEGSMLPLAGILDANEHVKRLTLHGTGMNRRRVRPAAGNGNSNARVLHKILSRNRCVESLDLSNTGLDNDGLAEICEALKKNNSVTHLNVARNHFGAEGCKKLEEALDTNQTLEVLDISRNALGFTTVRALQRQFQAGRRRGCSHCQLKLEGNYVFEEILNSLTHGIGFILSIIGTILLMSEAMEPDKTSWHFWGCAIFSASLMLLYLTSTLFHSLFMIPHASRILQVADHVAIYFLIAGSYTPFTMVGLHHLTSARVVLIAEWTAAISGSIFSMSSDLYSKSTMYVELLFYLAMGLAVVCVWPEVMASFSREIIALLVGGGASYIFGVIFFVAGNTVPIYHTIWHVFVMVASTLHWFAIYFYVVHTPIVAGGCVGPDGVNIGGIGCDAPGYTCDATARGMAI